MPFYYTIQSVRTKNIVCCSQFFVANFFPFILILLSWNGMAWHFVGNSIVVHCFFSSSFVQCTWLEIIKMQTFYYIILRINRQTKRQSVRIAFVYLLVHKHKFTSCYNWILCIFFLLFFRVLFLVFCAFAIFVLVLVLAAGSSIAVFHLKTFCQELMIDQVHILL